MDVIVVLLGFVIAALVVVGFVKLVAYDRAHADRKTSWVAWILFAMFFPVIALVVLSVRRHFLQREERIRAELEPVRAA